MRYNNYHKHDHYSNVRTLDVIVKTEDYIKRAKELGHTHIFSTNHGCSSNIYETYGLCKDNDLTCVFGMEMYYVDDRFSKESRTNYHLVVISLNSSGMKQINKINSEANKSGFYYHPRIDRELLLSLNPKDVVVTTACIHNRINHGDDNGIDEFLLPLKNHFGNHLFLEVQSHNHPAQIEWNKKILELSLEYKIDIIHGCDSHYIAEEDYKDRLIFLKGKGMDYGEENDFVLDYPKADTIFDRYRVQGILSDNQVEMALNNTLIFDKAEDLALSDNVKMPTIYPNLSVEDRYKKLLSIVKINLKEKLKTIPKKRHKEYVDAVKFEMDIIKSTNTEDIRIADYFLINERIINIGVNKYGGILTKTGRGSAVSFITNYLLGFTEVDRLDAEVPLYPTRFISKSRILETRSMPDIDFNTADPKPFIKSSKEVLGDDNCYYMIAYGTMKRSGAFRNMCRAKGFDMDEYNEFGKLISEVESHNDKELKKKEFARLEKNTDWGEIFKESEKFVGIIDSVSPSPCSFLLLNESISEEIGLMRVGDELCAVIDGYTSDVWKFLKNDILTVTVWKIISDVYKLIGQEIPTISELRKKLDKNVWDLYSSGLTATLNQVDSDFATGLMNKYKAKSPAELTAFVAAIRPSFASLLEGFLNRINYTTGVGELDKLLESSFQYTLYQENIMSYLTWLGVEEDKTYEIIKKISKKKLKKEELEELEKTMRVNWVAHVGNDKQFMDTWQVIQDAAAYGFNSAHALSVAWDSLYGAELKAHYPLEYYSVVLDIYMDNTEKTAKIQSELKHFGIQIKPIKFRHSTAKYSIDKSTNTIYKGISSIKFLSDKIADELYALRDNQYNSFTDLLVDIKTNTSVDTRQLNILTILGFFSEFGKNKKLLTVIEAYDKIGSRKQLKIADVDDLIVPSEIILKHAQTLTAKTIKDFNGVDIVREFESTVEDKSINLKERLKFEAENMGYIAFTYEKATKNIYFVLELTTYKDKAKPYITLYQVKTGETVKAKIINREVYIATPFNKGDVLVVDKMSQRPKSKLENGKWIKSKTEKENILNEYQVF